MTDGDSRRTKFQFPAWLTINGIQMLTESVFLVAFSWYAAQQATAELAAFVVAVGTVPRLLLILVAGVAADRYPARSIIIGATAIRTAMMIAIVAIALVGDVTIWTLLVASIVMGISDAFYSPATPVLVREQAPPDKMRRYQGSFEASSQAAGIGGQGIAGFIIAVGGILAAASINVVGGLALLLFFALFYKAPYPIKKNTGTSIWASIKGGLKDARHDRDIRGIMIMLAGSNLFLIPVQPIGITFRVNEMGLGVEILGILLSVVAVGGIAGSLLAALYRGRWGVALGVSLLCVQGLSLCLMALPYVEVLFASAVLLGFSVGAAGTMITAGFLGAVSEERIGRYVSMLDLADGIFRPILTIAFGLLVGAFGAGSSFLLFGAAMLVVFALRVPYARKWDIAHPVDPPTEDVGGEANDKS